MLVPGDAKRISTQYEEYVRQPDVKVGFDAAGEVSDYHTGEVLDWSLKNTETDDETTRIEKTAVLSRRQVQETIGREDHPHERAQQIQEKTRSGRELRHETTPLECLHLNAT